MPNPDNDADLQTTPARYARPVQQISPILKGVVNGGGYLAVFLLLAQISLGIDLWYLPAGVGLALLLAFGIRVAPLFFIAVLISDLWLVGSENPLLISALHALIATLGYSLAALILRNVLHIDLQLRRLKYLMWFIIVSAVAALIVASLSAASYGFAGIVTWYGYLATVLYLWLRDFLGIVGLTPFLLVVFTPWLERLAERINTKNIWAIKAAIRTHRIVQMGIDTLLQFSCLLFVFWLLSMLHIADVRLFYLCFLPIIWLALRYGLPGAAASVLVINIGTVLIVRVMNIEFSSATEMQLVLLILSVMGLLLGIGVTERKQIETERKALLAAEHKQRLFAETLADVALTLTSQTSPGAVLDEILRQVQRLVPYRTAHIVLLEGSSLRIAYWQGYQDVGSAAMMSNLVQPLNHFPIDAEVIQSRQPLLISDTDQEPRWMVQKETAWVKSHIVLPICLAERVLGLLRLDGDEPGMFTVEDLRGLQPLGNAAAIALENARLYDQARQEISERKQAEGALQDSVQQLKVAYEQSTMYSRQLNEEMVERKRAEDEIRRRNRELALLNRIIVASAKGLEEEAILDITCGELALAFEVSLTYATLLDESRSVETVVAEYRTQDRPTQSGKIAPVEGNAAFQYLIDNKAPLVVSNAQNDPRLAATVDEINRRGTVSLLLMPLIINGEIVGSLGIDAAESRDFSSAEVDLVWRVADQVVGALAQMRLTQERHRLSAAIEQTDESVVITDAEGVIVYINPAFERTTGYSRSETLGQSLLAVLRSDKHDGLIYDELWNTIATGEMWHGRLVNKKKNGDTYTEDVTITPIRDAQDTIVNYVSVQRDVTRELQLEAQYYQAQKMEAIGRLTGSIAHDFNNLLTTINGFADYLHLQLPPDDASQEVISKIRDAGSRATNLIDQLMAFSRKQPTNLKEVDLNKIVADIGNLLEPILGHNIQLKTILAPSLWLVKGNSTQLEQVIVNLVVNAHDAMPGGGLLTIKTANVVLDEQYTANHLGAKPGAYILLSIGDTGVGMSDETKAHIFEPFFTTKETGKGTGLGLATVFGIVEQSNGYIWVDSEQGQGTTFNIYLPRTKKTLAAPLQPIQATNLPQGTEIILVVEDEKSIRDLAVRLLRRQGYTVLEASNSTEAFQWANDYADKIDLLFTDMVMPEMSGQTLADQLTATYPDLKILIMSGHREKILKSNAELRSDVAFIQKPFSAVELIQKARAVLDA